MTHKWPHLGVVLTLRCLTQPNLAISGIQGQESKVSVVHELKPSPV